MKKIINVLVVFLVTMSLFSTHSQAATQNSPTTNYSVYINGENIPYYSKPGGKKLGTIPGMFGTYDNRLLVKKVASDYYTLVKFSKTKNGKKKYTGYVKNSDIHVNYNSLDYAVVRVASMNLRSKPSTSSKTITNIKRGTRVSVLPTGTTEDWYKVKYYKNGKKYTGYLSTKYLIQ